VLLFPRVSSGPPCNANHDKNRFGNPFNIFLNYSMQADVFERQMRRVYVGVSDRFFLYLRLSLPGLALRVG
jgi:hypothetical protein